MEATATKRPLRKKATPIDEVLSDSSTAKRPATRAPRAKRAVRSVYQEPTEAANVKRTKTKHIGMAAKHGKQQTFPQLVHVMVTETANVAPDVISWIANGEAFVVHDPMSAKLGEALQKYFNRELFGL